jgi:hypothetical protein
MCPVCGYKTCGDGGAEGECPACGCMCGRDYSDQSDHVRTWELRHRWADDGC